MHNYLTDVEDYSDANADAILAQHEPISIDNKELQEQYGMPDAYNYAIK